MAASVAPTQDAPLAVPVRCGHLDRRPAMAGSVSFEQTDEENQQTRNENRAAGQLEADNHEQRAADQEDRPPAAPDDPGEPPDADDREQRAGTEPPPEPPGERDSREARGTESIGCAQGRIPYNQVPAPRSHSHHSLLPPPEREASDSYSTYTQSYAPALLVTCRGLAGSSGKAPVTRRVGQLGAY